ncbi:ABC transporter permease [Micromonospora gifhornensis]|uniref:ABC transporter permease n=1 Tax=Micromonospora gifhornensis TaxID=84594 RepID=UPI00365A4C29
MRRILRTELRRGTAPWAAAAMCGAGVWMLAVHPEDWGGRWAGLVNYLRTSLLILCALMVAAGVWQAGRERRRGIDEMVNSTPRPGWQPVLVAWLAVTLAGTVGVLVAFAGAAVLVAPVATYAGDGWWWTLLVGVLALGAATAGGMCVGRLVRLRLAAPVAGLAAYLGLAILTYWDTKSAVWLAPVQVAQAAYQVVPGRVVAWQAGWLLALTVALLALAARRWYAAALAGALAVGVAVPIVTGPGPNRLLTDPDAVALVCTDSGPQVCVARIHAFLLDDVTPIVQPALARIEGIPGAPDRAMDDAARPVDQPQVPGDGTIWLHLDQQATVRGGLANQDWLASDLRAVTELNCRYYDHDREDERADLTGGLAHAWLFEMPASPVVPVDRLYALPMPAQRAWFADYLRAAAACDLPTLIRLGQPR